jgi:hypothetical protein
MSSTVATWPDGIVLTISPSHHVAGLALISDDRVQPTIGAPGLDAARADAVHTDIQRTELHRQFLREHPERCVARAAGRVQGDRLLRGAGDVDDHAAAAALHVRDDPLRARM